MKVLLFLQILLYNYSCIVPYYKMEKQYGKVSGKLTYKRGEKTSWRHTDIRQMAI